MDEQQKSLDSGTTAAATTTKRGRKPKTATAPVTSSRSSAQIISYRHPDRRTNNPEVGVVSEATDPAQPQTVWQYDPHLDPSLQFDSARSTIETMIDDALASGDTDTMRLALEELKRLQSPYLTWTGKAERTSFEVDTVSLHVHERIDPMSILAAVRANLKEGKKVKIIQPGLFEAPFESLPLRDAIDFYQHDKGWSNRLVAGDSLLVMNSLLQKESMAGQVQMIYIDPPYGIKYGSNFQPFVGKRDVKDRKDEDLTQEPEMIKAFRDTWELGIHSYLTYLRDRLLLAKELLSESGSVFVQISDENLHHVRELMDEVFGAANLIRIISIQKRSPQPDKFLSGVADYLVWYGKNCNHTKYNQLYSLNNSQTEDRNFVTSDMTSSHEFHRTSIVFEGNSYTPGARYWSTSEDGLNRLNKAGRILLSGKTLRYKRYNNDWEYLLPTNLWADVVFNSFSESKLYVVQTAEKVIERCLLMTTDPGDLVLDPTCVRRGTMVVTPPCPPVNGGEFSSLSFDSSSASSSPPFTGGLGGEVFTPVEALKPGEYVYSHDGMPHRIIRTIRKTYSGTMYGIRHAASSTTLWLTADHRVLVKRRQYVFSGGRNWTHNPHESFEKARALRNNTTTSENTLWQKLRGKQFGVKFRRQHPIGPYIVDFFSPERALIIELDGDSHFTADAIEYDQKRTEYLTASGVTVVRFTNHDIAANLEGVCERLLSIIGETAYGFREDAFWLPAEHLQPDDVVYQGALLEPIVIADILTEHTTEDVYDLEIEGAHSFLTEVCAVHNCGSGTTAFVAEKWGRRWITCDTSRVAVTLAKQRLMTASFDYYELRYPHEGLKGGFIYQTVPHVTLKSIANNPEIDEIYERMHPAVEQALAALNKAGGISLKEWEVPFDFPADWPEAARSPFDAFHKARQAMQKQMDFSIASHAEPETLYDKPQADKKKLRITGPFSVEAVPFPTVLSLDESKHQHEADVTIARSGESSRQHQWRDELLKTGIRGKGGQMLKFSELETLPGTRYLHASGHLNSGERVVISFGPEHAALEQRQVELALREAGELFPLPKMIVFCAFTFDPEAAKDIDQLKGITALKAQMNTDLLTEDLKKARSSNQSFWLMGQPDVEVRKLKDRTWQVEVHGFDYFDTAKGELVSGGKGKIAMWLLDTDYDERSLFPRQVFFPMAGKGEGWQKLKKEIRAELNEELLHQFHGTVSIPFEAGDNRKVAVKIVDDRGIESLKIIPLEG